MIIGIGIFQIPSGLFAAKYGPKRASIVGMTGIACGALLTSISTNITELAIFRFILGGALAFFLPATMILATKHFRSGSEALAIGTITGANAAGGLLGLIVWVILAQQVGWRLSIAIGAILAIALAAALYFFLPKVAATTRPAIKLSSIRSLLLDRTLIIVGLFLLGSQIVLEQTSAFMPFYLQSALNIDPAVAGLVGSIVLFSALAGAPITGWLSDRKMQFKKLVLTHAIGLLIGASINFTLTLPAAIISTILIGFSAGGLFTLFTNTARQRSLDPNAGINPQFSTLSLNWIHAIALAGTLWAPIVFSATAVKFGYSVAWPMLGVIAFVILLVLLFLNIRIFRFVANSGSVN